MIEIRGIKGGSILMVYHSTHGIRRYLLARCQFDIRIMFDSSLSDPRTKNLVSIYWALKDQSTPLEGEYTQRLLIPNFQNFSEDEFDVVPVICAPLHCQQLDEQVFRY